MAKVSNSFHSSSRKHAISNGSKLAQVQSHNDRGYFSWQYDPSKIHHLIGNNDTLVDDVKEYINTKFNPEIEKSNERQKQACRRIKTDAYTHFCENKKLDIANEVIFQLADRDYWSRCRQEKLITRNKKSYVVKSYPEEVKEVMDDIFKKQAAAYEQIYETHKDIILAKIQEAYASATEHIEAMAPEQKELFEKIAKTKPKDRRRLLDNLNDQELEAYALFFEHYETKLSIDKQHLIDRVQSGALEIKLINLTGHYDEWSPHAHGVSVCSASGYGTGLNSRVAKSVVLNKYALEVIQDRMREIAKEEIKKHPELFPDTELAEKGKGRNLDYETEQWIRMKQDELVERVTDLTNHSKALKHNTLQQEILLQKKKDEVAEWDKVLEEVGDEKAYIEESKNAYGVIDTLQSLLNQLVTRVSPMRDKTLEKTIMDAFKGFYEVLTHSLERLRMYEVRERIPEEACESVPISKAKKSLDEMIAGTKVHNKEMTDEEYIEQSIRKMKKHNAYKHLNLSSLMYDEEGHRRSLAEQLLITAYVIKNGEAPPWLVSDRRPAFSPAQINQAQQTVKKFVKDKGIDDVVR